MRCVGGVVVLSRTATHDHKPACERPYGARNDSLVCQGVSAVRGQHAPYGRTAANLRVLGGCRCSKQDPHRPSGTDI